MNRRSTFQLVVLGVLFFSSVGFRSASGQMNKIETAHMSDDSFCIVRLDIQKLIGYEKMGSKAVEQIATALKEEAGMELMQMKTMTLQFSPSDTDRNDPGFAVTFEFAKDFDKETFMEKIGRFEGLTETEFMGKTYLRARDDDGPHIYFKNKKTFTMATSKAIESVIKAGSGMGTMAGMIKSAAPGSEISAAFRSNEGFEAIANEIMQEIPPLGLPIDPLKSILSVKSGMGHVNLRSSTPFFIQLSCKNKAAATQMKGLANFLIEMGKASIPGAKAQVKEQLEGLENAEGFRQIQKSQMEFAEKGLDISEKVLAGAKALSKDDVVTVKVNKMGGMPEVVGLFIEGMQGLFLGIDQIEIEGADFLEEAPIRKAAKDVKPKGKNP